MLSFVGGAYGTPLFSTVRRFVNHILLIHLDPSLQGYESIVPSDHVNWIYFKRPHNFFRGMIYFYLFLYNLYIYFHLFLSVLYLYISINCDYIILILTSSTFSSLRNPCHCISNIFIRILRDFLRFVSALASWSGKFRNTTITLCKGFPIHRTGSNLRCSTLRLAPELSRLEPLSVRVRS